MRARAIGLATAGVIGLVLVAGPASAATQPEHSVITDLAWFQQNWAVGDVDCGSFTIHETAVIGRQETKAYFDDSGTVTKVYQHTSFDGRLTNLSTGKTLRDHVSENSWFPVVNGNFDLVITSGIDWHLVDAHQGIEVAVNGHLIHDQVTGEIFFSAGPHDVPSQKIPDLCSLLT